MAIYYWQIESRKKGRAAPQSEYIWGTGAFEHKQDVIHTGCGNLPSWCNGNPRVFFEAADFYERENGSACRVLVIWLPRELSPEAWIKLVEDLIFRDLRGKPYQYAIHLDPMRDGEHPHAHIIYSDRIPDGIDRDADTFFLRPNAKAPERGGCKKDSGGKSPIALRIELLKRKELWADLQNEALQAAGYDVRVDHRSIAPALAAS